MNFESGVRQDMAGARFSLIHGLTDGPAVGNGKHKGTETLAHAYCLMASALPSPCLKICSSDLPVMPD